MSKGLLFAHKLLTETNTFIPELGKTYTTIYNTTSNFETNLLFSGTVNKRNAW